MPSESGWRAEYAARLAELQQQVDNLQIALATQRTIGTAVGFLARRYGCTTGRAWNVLTRLSQDSNVKVREVARVLSAAFDGDLDGDDARLFAAISGSLPGHWRRAGAPASTNRTIGDDLA